MSKIIAGIVRKNIRKNMAETNPVGAKKIWKLMWNMAFYVLVIFAFFISFEIMWMNIWLLISWVSLWLWLAFKEILWNMFAGMMILYTKEFRMWDIIEIQSDQTFFGRIEEITIRYTVIRTLDLRQVVIPNMTMISKPIKTFSSENIVKLNTIVWIHYDSDVSKAIQVVTQAINSFDFVQSKDNTTVYVTNFGDSAIDLKCIFCFDPNCGIIWDFAIWYINEKISEEFNKHCIKIPYKHSTLTFEKPEEKEKLLNNLTNTNHINNLNNSK
jgi:small-conductance mechanosensitive channel